MDRPETNPMPPEAPARPGGASSAAGGAARLVTCDTCPHHCALAEGALGLCRARRRVGGHVVCESYGRLTSLALDPVEKKPLARWRPGSLVLSAGSYGCNLRCPFCQNWEISQAGARDVPWREVSPERLVALALDARAADHRVTGIAHTYNEPLVGWEYVRDCGRLAHRSGLANVLVSNGCASEGVIRELAPLVDAANIDLKAFDERLYRACGGSLAAARRTIELLAATPSCHLEVTTLVIPGENDGPASMEAEARWLASVDPDITLHVTRFFPRWHMQDRGPTPVADVRALADVARRHLPHVFVGNC